MSLSFVVSVRSFCFQSLSPPTSTSSGSSSSFLLFTSLCISLCFQCLCMCHLCAMSIKLFFPVVVVVRKSSSRENGNATWCTITREVHVGTPVGCLLAYNSG